MKKIVIATGGTGGHIYPALALAEIVKKEYPNCEIIFFGSSNRMEAKLIPDKGYRFIGMEMTGMNGGIKAKLASMNSMHKAKKECLTLLKKEKPDICIGFGNYISVPLIMAASKLHIPTMIHEQNSFPGKANRLLGHFVDAIAVSYASSLKNFPKDKTRLLGNPQATLASNVQKNEQALAQYGFTSEKPSIVFMMGSLGSSSVSKVIDESLGLLDESIQVLVVAGKSNEYQFHTQNSDRIQIVPYVNGVEVLKNCDLAICRAGATTLCEICAIGTPSILIPSPFVPNNHQVINAMELVNEKAALMIEEKDLNTTSLSNTINGLITQKETLESMKENAKKLGKPEAAYDMLKWMKEIISHD